MARFSLGIILITTVGLSRANLLPLAGSSRTNVIPVNCVAHQKSIPLPRRQLHPATPPSRRTRISCLLDIEDEDVLTVQVDFELHDAASHTRNPWDPGAAAMAARADIRALDAPNVCAKEVTLILFLLPPQNRIQYHVQEVNPMQKRITTWGSLLRNAGSVCL